jgi:hypothetical protein
MSDAIASPSATTYFVLCFAVEDAVERCADGDCACRLLREVVRLLRLRFLAVVCRALKELLGSHERRDCLLRAHERDGRPFRNLIPVKVLELRQYACHRRAELRLAADDRRPCCPNNFVD